MVLSRFPVILADEYKATIIFKINGLLMVVLAVLLIACSKRSDGMISVV
ncbi:hypothetical protein PU629_01150 [Pullulanibacillus sp. KACC 23026]|nr:hypothetical protein [Pullulanibacillus sp. KACC 23026]WEG12994.1 hypothetical protein PU629_01150 [Pullulanibacillus sp. KACC 23026]